jgi:imidazoleglycerol phosphate dehydratase HisB
MVSLQFHRTVTARVQNNNYAPLSMQKRIEFYKSLINAAAVTVHAAIFRKKKSS